MTLHMREADRRFVIGLCAWTLNQSGQHPGFRNVREMIRLLQKGSLYIATWLDEEGKELFCIQINPAVVECLQSRVLH